MTARRVPSFSVNGEARIEDHETCILCYPDDQQRAEYVIDANVLCVQHAREELGI